MAMKHMILALCLAIAPAAGLVSDESCLVQSQRDVVAKRSAALAHEKPSLPESLKAMSTNLRQLPNMGNVMSMLPPGMDFSMEAMMNMGMEMMSLFKNKTIVAVMEKNLAEMGRGLLAFSSALETDGAKFVEDLDAAVNESDVLVVLQDFLTVEVKKVAAIAANMTVGMRKFGKMMPAGSSMANFSKSPMFAMLANLSGSDVEKYVGEQFLLPQTKKMCQNQTAFCTTFAPYEGNISFIARGLKDNGMQFVDMAKQFVPQVTGMIQGFAPDAAEPLGKIIDQFVALMEKVVPALQKSLPPAAEALTKASTERLHCKAAKQEQSGHSGHSGAAPQRLGLVAAVAAAVAWLAVA